MTVFLTGLWLWFGSSCGGDAGTPASGENPPTNSAPADMSLREFHDGCLASGCHEGLGAQRWLHGPVASGNCATCHEAQGAEADHLFQITIEGAGLCFSCHESRDPGAYEHEPHAEGLCLDCHDPHGGTDKSFIHTQTAAELCAQCHEDRDSSFGHTPVVQGDCMACHLPHSSRHEHLLSLDESELCIGCHRKFSGLLPENMGRGGLSLANAHQVLVDDGCLACHRAHGASHAALLERPSRDLCESCHEEVVSDLPGAKTVHGAFLGEDSCVQCHSPHASTFDSLLRDSPATLCFQCHDQEIVLPSGGQVVDIVGQISGSAHVHQPVVEGECTVCHLAHFSYQRSLLRLEYPDHIYADFDEEGYGLCFQCHDQYLAEEERYVHTGFREGDTNLHFVHVHRDKGRACDICHRPHGSGYPQLLRSSYAFGPGRWEMQIGYEQTERGGTCTSACHERESYDRSIVPASPGQSSGK